MKTDNLYDHMLIAGETHISRKMYSTQNDKGRKPE